jgi:Predicted GTPase
MINENIFEVMEKDILNTNLEEKEKSLLLRNLFKLKSQKINIMVVGATGVGKSSTINALFGSEISNVGVGVNPETMEISKYELGNLILWDSPGLGDGKEADKRHTKNIIKKLKEVDIEGNLFIDLVLVILDCSTRDLGSSYELINNVVIPNLGIDKDNRILVALNQADLAMKGRYWNYEKNEPEQKLKDFLENKVFSIKNRIKEATGVNTTPIYYSAGFKEEGEVQTKPYNLSKLLYYIIKSTPREKRLVYVEKINSDSSAWSYNDNKKNYSSEIMGSFFDTVTEYAMDGGNIGVEIGAVFGRTGEVIGKTIGTIAGSIVGGIKSIFSRIF